MTAPPVPVPRYGEGALPDLPESVLATFGAADAANVLDLTARPRVCVLIIDGLGWELLTAHLELAPFLASLTRGRLTAGFPATTATSLGSLGTGVSPARHGLLGYQVLVPGTGRLLNHLRWTSDQVDPLVWQPRPTAYERAAAAGVSVAYVASRLYANSGLSVATTRGASYTPADGLGQLVAQAEIALRAGDRTYVTVYHPDLDSTGHAFGAGSPAWCHQLRFVDALAERVAEVLPPDAALYVTADHGMTNPAERVDAEASPLSDGVALLGGEPRARHVYAVPGAAADVLATWQETLGDRAWVLPREEAVAAGWFGDAPLEMLPRIGDVLAVPFADVAILSPAAEPLESKLIGMHGSLVPAEQLVPLLTRLAPGDA